MNRLTEMLDRPEPTIAVAFTESMAEDAIQNIASVADVAEFRADRFPSHEPNYLTEQAKKLAILPLLLTIRFEPEGGGWAAGEKERLGLFNKLLPQADGVDIELAADILPDVTEMAHDTDKVVIVSSHDFIATPSVEILEEKFARALDAGADYVKFATSARNSEDFQRLVSFTLDHRQDNVIVVAMDEYGPLSRIALPAMGSHLTYAFPGEVAVAPGQLSYVETNQLLKDLYPDYLKLNIEGVTKTGDVTSRE